jgi:hypothetical protein
LFGEKYKMVGRGLIATGLYPTLNYNAAGAGLGTYSGQMYGGPVETPQNALARKFGLARLYERNKDLLNMLNDPHQALNTVNNEMIGLKNTLSATYQNRMAEFRRLGLGDEEAIARADIMTGRELENDVSLMMLKHPYSMGGSAAGGWDPISALLMSGHGAGVFQPSQGQKFARGMASVDATGGLGLKKKISKKFKRKFKRKFRR